MHRRDTSDYESHSLNGVEVLTLPELSRHVISLRIDLQSFLFFRNLRGAVEFDNGMVVGKAGSQTPSVELSG